MPPPGTCETERLARCETLPFLNQPNAQSMQLPGWGMPQPYSYDGFDIPANSPKDCGFCPAVL